MEHLTSTQIIESGALADPGLYEGLDTVAQVLRFECKATATRVLGPWIYPARKYHGLWVAEGFTNYYGHLMMRRTSLGRGALSAARALPSRHRKRRYTDERRVSLRPFLDDALHAQHTNLENTTISYYPKGELIAWCFDLLIRGKSYGKASLDEVMRQRAKSSISGSNNSYYRGSWLHAGGSGARRVGCGRLRSA